MPGSNTPKKTPRFNHGAAVHEPFSWLDDAAKNYPLADFVALTLDVCNGINTCLDIFNSSEHERSSNCDALPGEEITPAVNSCDADRLLRLSIAEAQLLSESAERRIRWIDEHVLARLEAANDAAE